uniref:Non-specific lipid-transfer protein n=1 Tax=Kalanchoe fedtschenkoi TaxID=63787 RepID=A0A7N0USP6_KALFE
MAAFFHRATLLCVLLLAAAPGRLHAQMSCNQMVNGLTPCVGYLLNGGAVAPQCCTGVRAIYGAATTTPSRQAICRCLKSTIANFSYNNNNLKNAQGLPGKCGVNIPYQISPNINCDQVQ